MNRFEQKTVLVIGAPAFAAEGARVIIAGRDRAALDEAEAAISNGVIALQGDASRLVGWVARAADCRGRRFIVM